MYTTLHSRNACSYCLHKQLNQPSCLECMFRMNDTDECFFKALVLHPLMNSDKRAKTMTSPHHCHIFSTKENHRNFLNIWAFNFWEKLLWRHKALSHNMLQSLTVTYCNVCQPCTCWLSMSGLQQQFLYSSSAGLHSIRMRNLYDISLDISHNTNGLLRYLGSTWCFRMFKHPSTTGVRASFAWCFINDSATQTVDSGPLVVLWLAKLLAKGCFWNMVA